MQTITRNAIGPAEAMLVLDNAQRQMISFSTNPEPAKVVHFKPRAGKLTPP